MKLSELKLKSPPPSISNIINTKIGKLFILGYSGHSSDNRYFVNVQCDCGVTRIVNASNILYGSTRSCGCIKKDNKLKNE